MNGPSSIYTVEEGSSSWKSVCDEGSMPIFVGDNSSIGYRIYCEAYQVWITVLYCMRYLKKKKIRVMLPKLNCHVRKVPESNSALRSQWEWLILNNQQRRVLWNVLQWQIRQARSSEWIFFSTWEEPWDIFMGSEFFRGPFSIPNTTRGRNTPNSLPFTDFWTLHGPVCCLILSCVQRICRNRPLYHELTN